MPGLVRYVVYCVIGLGLFLAFAPDQARLPGNRAEAPHQAGRLVEETLDLPVREPMSDYNAPRGRFATSVFLHDGAERRWHWIAPEGDGPSPAIVLLHGSGRNGAAMLDMAKSLAKQGYFLIAPDAAVAEAWSPTQDGPDFIAALLEQAQAVGRIDPARVYLMGHSAGGNHALWLANRGGGTWRGVAVHAGTIVPQDVAPRRDAPPVLIVLGDRDAFYPVATVRAAADALAKAGHDVTLQVVPGHDHWFYIIGPRFARHSEAFLNMAAPAQ